MEKISFDLPINQTDFGEIVVGSQIEKNIKLLTSTGSIDLFIKKIEIDNNQFTFRITQPKNI